MDYRTLSGYDYSQPNSEPATGANISNSDLADNLITCGSLDAAVKAYDTISMPRAISTVKFSRWSIDLAHATGWRLTTYRLFLKMVSWFMAA